MTASIATFRQQLHAAEMAVKYRVGIFFRPLKGQNATGPCQGFYARVAAGQLPEQSWRRTQQSLAGVAAQKGTDMMPVFTRSGERQIVTP